MKVVKLLLYLIFALVGFLASIVGSMTGIGGGVLIKPILDLTGLMSVASISFLSGATVLSMSVYAVAKAYLNRDPEEESNLGTIVPLGLGAAIGGIIGKNIFDYFANTMPNPDGVGGLQSIVLGLVTLITLIYAIKEDSIRTHRVRNTLVIVIIGLLLGIISAFLGIGGGPINLMVLSFLFSMDITTAALSSLNVIMFSQIASIGNTILTNNVPTIPIPILILMVISGILGAAVGRKIEEKMSSRQIRSLYIFALIVIIVLNIINTYRFLG